jgi:hypothetical protein
VKKDILALRKSGINVVELCDANFGAFKDRDLTIYKMAWDHGLILSGLSLVKLTNLERKKQLIDKFIDIVITSDTYKNDPMAKTWDIIPAIAVQSTSDEAISVTKRVDLSGQEKIELAQHINYRRKELDLPDIFPDFIMGMPGSTLDDFYRDFEVFWNQKTFQSWRYVYMILPDTENSHPDYLKAHGIKMIEVYSDFDNDTISGPDLYRNRKCVYHTLSECNTLSSTDMYEIWIMNFLGNYILKNFYPRFEDQISVADFMKMCWRALQMLPFFQLLWQNAVNLFDPNTPPMNSERMLDRTNHEFGVWLIDNYGAEILNFLEKKIDSRLLTK